MEQIVRIAFLLAGAFTVLYIFHGEISTAVSLSTFAAFVGAIGSLGVLFWYWYKRKPYLNELLLMDKGTVEISLKDMYKEILLYAAPFVFVGIANPLFQFIDQLTFNRAMVDMGLAEEADFALNKLNFYSHKLVIIPVSLATGFSLTLVPSITKSYIEQDWRGLHRMLNQTFQVLLFITIPAVAGMSLLAEPIYTVFYQPDPLGSAVLQAYAPVAILFALYSVTAAIMQGINEQRFTILSLLVGLLIKLSLNIPLIKLMETKGAVLATALGYGAAIIINLVVIKMYARYPYKLVWRRTLLIVLFTFLMLIGTGAAYQILTLFLSPEYKGQSLIIILVCALIGALIYSYLGLRSKLVNLLFGDKVDRLKQKLHLKI